MLKTVDATSFARGWLNWQPHPGQLRWLAAPERSTAVLVTGRRWGKDEAEAVKALHQAVFRPGSKQLFASVTLDQARIPWDRCARFISDQPLLSALLVGAPTESPFPLLRFRNGSTITARSTAREGVYIRGHDYDRVILTEADYLSERMITEVVRLTLADRGGRLVMQTTPRRRGFVYRELQRGLAGNPAIYAQTGTTFENPHVDHNYIHGLRERMTAAAWRREVEGLYVDDDIAVFGWEHIQAAYSSADWVLPLKVDPSRRWVGGADLAKTEDWTVIAVLDATSRPWKLGYFERFQRRPWPEVEGRIRAVAQRYGMRQNDFAIDATGVGAAVLDGVKDVAVGFTFTSRSKVDLLTNLQLLLEHKRLLFPFVRELVDELQEYAWDDKALTTDCVMALALACWAAEHGRSRQLVVW